MDGDGGRMTVACSAPGMFHSRPWYTRTPRLAARAATMSGVILSIDSFWCATPPWSVTTIQSRPYLAAFWTNRETGFMPSGLYWEWMWWSPRRYTMSSSYELTGRGAPL